MTQIVTVSPATAAYAAQGMRTPTRPSTGSLFEQRIHYWSEDARVKGDAKTLAFMTVIRPPALALALITSTNLQPQVTVAEAQRLYDENAPSAPPGAT